MTIDDEMILELIKPDRYGKVGKDALIVKIVGTRKIDYKLEESKRDLKLHARAKISVIDVGIETEAVKMTPDITVTIPHEQERQIAIELENDIQWDFGESLRQVKKYKGEFDDTRVIIPEEYKRFALLYKNEGFRVYLWKAMRKWQCLRCGTITEKEGPVSPKCKKCNRHTKHRLIGLKDADVEEYM